MSLTGSSNAFDDLGSSTARYGCCDAGTYMAQPELNPFVKANACQNCPLGYFGTAASNDDPQCFECDSGKYNDQNGQTSCVVCATGAYSETGQSSCKTCGVGQYTTSAASLACQTCETGTFQELNEASEYACKFCVAGKKFDTKTTACIDCVDGQYQESNTKTPWFVKRVLLDCIPPVPLLCARIAKKASTKHWLNPSNTIVNFVPKQRHLIRPVAVVLRVQVVNSKNKIRRLQSRANNVLQEPNGKQLQTCVKLATMENTKIKTLPIQSLVNFVPPVNNSPPRPPVVRCA